MGVFLFFVDGLGLGPGGENNPLAQAKMPFLTRALGARLLAEDVPGGFKEGPLGFVISTDALLGVPGIPQSATGQAALLTGKNAPAIVGCHVNALPTRELRELLRRENLLGRARAQGFRVQFLNAYRPLAFEAMGKGTYHASVTTVTALASGIRLRDFGDLLHGEAVYHDMTHETLAASGYEVPKRSPREAGIIARRVASQAHLTLYEFFLTDMAGHRQDREAALRLLGNIDAFLEALDPGEGVPVVMTSDHGNVEDLSTGEHTLNPVPTVVLGGSVQSRAAFRGVRSILGIAPAVMDCLSRMGKEGDGDGARGAMFQDRLGLPGNGLQRPGPEGSDTA
jgi:hypothetical protein